MINYRPTIRKRDRIEPPILKSEYQPTQPTKVNLAWTGIKQVKLPATCCTRTFTSIDGEGFTLPGGRHIYNLIGASDSSYLRDDKGIPTLDALEYLLSLKRNHPNDIFVSFYFSYDANMIVSDLYPQSIADLRENNACYLCDSATDWMYRIEFIPRRLFRVSKGHKVRKNGDRIYDAEESITIWDTYGFFQSSFAVAVEDWGITDSDTLSWLKDMKADRAEFTSDNFEKTLAYNRLECRLLVDLMNRLSAAMDTCEIRLQRWDGAGSIAAALMRKHQVKQHIIPLQDDLNEPVMSAYFGGRIQAIQIGEFEHVYSHDIISAYPSALVNLPSLRGSRFIHHYGLPPAGSLALFHIRWNLPDCPICPFPLRDTHGSIHYPHSGEGWYWSVEADLPLRLYGSEGINTDDATNRVGIETIESYEIRTPDESKPFEFIRDLFEQRQQFKADTNEAQYPLKLGLNSLYGKTAQAEGWRKDEPPSYQCYIWAGIVTATIRARMWSMAQVCPESVISFATDGIYSTMDLTAPTDNHNGLGGIETDLYDRMLMIKSGMFHAENKTHEIKRHRGFESSELAWNTIRAEWRARGILGSIPVETTRFVGMQQSETLNRWRQWETSQYTMQFWPFRDIPTVVSEYPLQFRLIPDVPPVQHSVPYSVELFPNKSSGYDLITLDEI